jgi:shikimate dehydrogenase
MHRAALQYFKLSGSYDLLDAEPERLHERVDAWLEDGYVGFNVTIPHKEAMFHRARHRTEEAERAAAANTIKSTEHGLKAHNTDICGLRKALAHHFPEINYETTTAYLLGAGGASRAALIALEQLGCRQVRVIAREPGKASATINSVTLSHPERVLALSTQAHTHIEDDGEEILLINATPIGQKSSEIPEWASALFHGLGQGKRQNKHRYFFDMVYSKTNTPTPLVSRSRELQWLATDGKDMLIHQAAAAFEFWTGNLPPFAIMESAFISALSA